MKLNRKKVTNTSSKRALSFPIELPDDATVEYIDTTGGPTWVYYSVPSGDND